MKKEEVFVVIDSKKVAKKLSKVLAMFNEKQYDNDAIECALKCKDVIHFWDNISWAWGDEICCLKNDKKEVSVSELKQILAMEHLKTGDVIVASNPKNKKGWVLKLEGDNKYFMHKNIYCLQTEKFMEYIVQQSISYGKFIRYATEEEKQLLNPGAKEDEKNTVDFTNYFKEVENDKKDLEIGKWYFADRNDTTEHKALVFLQGHGVKTYGFTHAGLWTNDYVCFNTFCNPNYKYAKATGCEVSERFFKECHKRYSNKIGFIFNNITNEITACDEIIFKNGTWLEAKKIEIDPFKELKEAHKKGFEIEYKSSSGQWRTSSNPAWRKTGNYRIRPRKIGDWIRTTNSVTNVNAYIQINETNINSFNIDGVRVSNQMVIDILNNGKYTV